MSGTKQRPCDVVVHILLELGGGELAFFRGKSVECAEDRRIRSLIAIEAKQLDVVVDPHEGGPVEVEAFLMDAVVDDRLEGDAIALVLVGEPVD